MKEISISKIKKLGRKIRRNLRDKKEITNEMLDDLQNYRVQHLEPLRTTFDFLVKKSRIHYKGSVVVYRLKRIDTILRKIERYKTMDLAKMQDIAGCRTIVFSNRQIYKIVNEFKESSNFEIINFDDYIENVRDTGYSSYHLIVRPKNSKKVVEIQLRTQIQHHWATLVEITDLLYKIKLKEGQDHRDLYSFHKLLAKNRDNILSIDEMERLVNIDKEYEIIKKLVSIFKSNYYQSIKSWLKSLPEKTNNYLIMQLNESLTPTFSFFESFQSAENEYYKKFSLTEPNMVLIHMINPDFEKLGLAYSNYVLTSHPSIMQYIEILRRLILESKKSNNPIYKELKRYYDEIISLIDNSFSTEIECIDLVISKSINIASSSINLLSNWRDSSVKIIDDVRLKNESFLIEYESIPIKTWIDKLFSPIIK